MIPIINNLMDAMSPFNRTDFSSQEENQSYEDTPGNTQNTPGNTQNNIGEDSSDNSQQSPKTIETIKT